MPSATPLVKVYVDALCGRAIYVHAAFEGGISRISFEPEADAKFEVFAKLWFTRPAHAELVYMRCVQDFGSVGAMGPGGWVDMPPAGVSENIKAVAISLGARWQTEAEIQRDAEKAVADIVRYVKDAQQDGHLKEVNYAYKIYRQQQIAKAEPAMPYSAHLAKFTRSLVILAAQKSMQ